MLEFKENALSGNARIPSGTEADYSVTNCPETKMFMYVVHLCCICETIDYGGRKPRRARGKHKPNRCTHVWVGMWASCRIWPSIVSQHWNTFCQLNRFPGNRFLFFFGARAQFASEFARLVKFPEKDFWKHFHFHYSYIEKRSLRWLPQTSTFDIFALVTYVTCKYTELIICCDNDLVCKLQ